MWARARHRSVGVMVVNVDRFDAVNENFGRALGDRLLVELGQRLVECSLRTDTIGRLEGDKFIVVHGAVGDPSEMVSYADEIRAALEQPFLLDGEAEVVTVSIGIALGSQDESPDRLMSNAELAVVHAKESGGDRAVPVQRESARGCARPPRVSRLVCDGHSPRASSSSTTSPSSICNAGTSSAPRR